MEHHSAVHNAPQRDAGPQSPQYQPAFVRREEEEGNERGRCVTWIDRKITQPVAAWWQLIILERLLRQRALPASKSGRCIPLSPYLREDLHDDRRGTHASYISNSIRSARYTIWDFLPRQLWFQATRLNNVYFICIGVPQTIPGLSTTGNYTTILPLLFFMLLTIVKEGIDDWRRHRMDRVENGRRATVLREKRTQRKEIGVLADYVVRIRKLLGRKKETPIDEKKEMDIDEELAWTHIKWRDIKVGDVIRLERDDAVPADIILLSTTGDDGVAYVETMALDGETNLKTKQAPTMLRACHDIATIKASDAQFTVEDPNRNLYDYNGKVTTQGQAIPLTLNEILLRGCVLRNVGSAIGIVANTGEECKIRMNANHHPKAKKPRLERYSNQVVLTLVAYVIILSVGVSMGYIIWHRTTERNSWYLNNAYVPFKEIIVGYFIMFNNVIPLALYVSLEIVKIGQMIMVHGDIEMFDQASNTPMTCNTNTILENLGQVSYVLSDKTGTLTENVMKFRKMSVAGVAWSHYSATELDLQNQDSEIGHDIVQVDEKKISIDVETRELSSSDQDDRDSDRASLPPSVNEKRAGQHGNVESNDTTRNLLQYIRRHPSSAFSRKVHQFILAIALCHTALPDNRHDGSIDFQASSPDEIALVRAAQDLGILMVQRSTQLITLEEHDEHGQQVQHVYEILDVIEFSSKRKRMSIIVRCPDGNLWLLCKGADNVITPRLRQATLASRKSHEVRRSIQLEREAYRRSEQLEVPNSLSVRRSLTTGRGSSMDISPVPRTSITLAMPKASHDIRIQTRSLDVPRHDLEEPSLMDDAAIFTRSFRQLDEFANEGLRTLVYSDKIIPRNEYDAWKKVFTDATTSLENRQLRIENAGEIIEQGMDLLGVSAIEDKLQDGVPETIEKLRRANIKIWMLTGDKRETAINIAHSARICKPESEICILDATKGNIDDQLRTLLVDLKTGCLHSVVVIDGHTLSGIDQSPALQDLFYTLIPLLDSVICCRASPAQKASLVKSIRIRIPDALTLAIGDGANDIAMIQASHVGVGISGKEGLQAARVADYSIAQFRFLQRLLFVHGRWNYIRTAKFILWTFWKEMFFYMMQALYLHHNGYTGTSLYENWSLTVLNTLFTSLCVIIPGIFEQDLAASTLLAVPELYIHGQRNMDLYMSKYFRWVVRATFEGVVVWFLSYAAFSTLNPTVSDNGLFALGDLCFSTAIVYTNAKLLILETHTKTIIVGVAFTITVGGWWAWNAFMSAVYSSNLSPYDVKGGFTNGFGKDPTWWLTLLLAVTGLTLVEVLVKLARRDVMALWQNLVSWGGKGEYKAGTEEIDIDVELWQGLEKSKAVISKRERRL